MKRTYSQLIILTSDDEDDGVDASIAPPSKRTYSELIILTSDDEDDGVDSSIVPLSKRLRWQPFSQPVIHNGREREVIIIKSDDEDDGVDTTIVPPSQREPVSRLVTLNGYHLAVDWESVPTVDELYDWVAHRCGNHHCFVLTQKGKFLLAGEPTQPRGGDVHMLPDSRPLPIVYGGVPRFGHMLWSAWISWGVSYDWVITEHLAEVMELVRTSARLPDVILGVCIAYAVPMDIADRIAVFRVAGWRDPSESDAETNRRLMRCRHYIDAEDDDEIDRC
jgi:hypothetical protein